MKILDLPLKTKWYDMIESGEKKRSVRHLQPQLALAWRGYSNFTNRKEE